MAAAIVGAASLGLGAEPVSAPAQREAELIAALGRAATWEEKDKACRELQVVGTTACVPALAACLVDKEISHPARLALEPMPFPEAGQALGAALARTEGQLRIGIINSLGVRQEPLAGPLLLPLLQDPDPELAAAAVVALGRIATPEAAQALATLRRTPPDGLGAAIAEASLLLAEGLEKRGDAPAAAAIYEELQADRWPEAVRLGAFVGLLEARPADAVPAVVAALLGDDRLRRAVAIASIARLEGDEVTARFAAELPKLPPTDQVLLIGVLTARGRPVRGAILEAGRGSTTAEVRVAAARGLGRVGDAPCVPWLAELLTTAQTQAERDAASQALLQLEGDAVGAELTRLTKAAPPAVRSQLIELLWRRNETRAAAMLLGQAKDRSPEVRRAAFKALSRLAGPGSLKTMLKLLVAEADDEARAEAERAVAQVARQITPAEARADAVLQTLPKQKSPAVRASLLRVLAGIGNGKGLAVVQDRVKVAGEPEREAAVRALAAWPDAGAVDALLGLVRATDSKVHRTLAVRGLVRLLTPPSDVPLPHALVCYRDAASAVQQDAEAKKAVLAGLQHLPHAEALALALAWLEDKDAAAEAALAAVKIADAIVAVDRVTVVAAMTKVTAAAAEPALQEQARQVLRRAEQFEDYVVAWLVTDAYTESGKEATQLFDVPFPPEQGDGSGARWRPLTVRNRGQQPWMLDLTDAFGVEQSVGYVRTWVHAEQASPARIEAGVDDGIKIWLNGKTVYANNAGGAAVPAEEKADVALVQGWNLLLLKISQQTGPCEFCLRFRTPEGGALPGLRVDPTHDLPPGAALGPSPAQPQAGSQPQPTAAAKANLVADSAGWVQLFNGTDLSGWRQTGKAVFAVENGCLAGTQTDGQGGDLWHDSDWDNFEMRATYRVTWPANSGIWFRHDGRQGYQYDILKWPDPVAFSATLYCPGKMFLTRNQDEAIEVRDGWNEARLRADGEELTLWLNGKETGRCRDATLTRGKFGIQVHGGDEFKGMRIVFKELAVRDLRNAPASTGDAASLLRFVMHRVGSFRSEACGVGDVNRDGRLDIVAGPLWYEAPDWKPHKFRELSGNVGEDGKGYYDDFMNALLDVDGDGWLDVVTCCWFAKQMQWFRNPGPAGTDWLMAVAEQNGNYETGDLWDVDGDGKAYEIVPATSQTDWFEPAVGTDGQRRLRRYEVSATGRPFGSGVGDVNGDGRPDLLRPNAWFEAPPDPRQGQWIEHAWSLGARNGGTDHTPQILVNDVDGDGLNDVVTSSAHQYGIFWYRQLRQGTTATWEQHVIDDTWSQAHSLVLADLDGDGDRDLVTGKRFMAHNGGDPDEDAPLGVYWYELQRGPGAPAWVRHAISYDEGIGAGLNLCVVDLDGDGDLDVITTGKWGGPVWFETQRR